MTKETRTETDSMGKIDVPANALWRAQTERARQNFQLSELRFPTSFISALAAIKASAAQANQQLDILTDEQADAIVKAAEAVIDGDHFQEFPLDIFQTGSGTSTNMNMNEVLTSLADQQSGVKINPNDHVNASQSSNDVIPTAIQVGVTLSITKNLIPALNHLQQIIENKANTLTGTVKTGRTHLMDAMPITMAQELQAWNGQIAHCQQALEHQLKQLSQLPQGGTAVGTGINAPRQFSGLFCDYLSKRTVHSFTPAANLFTGIAGQEVNLLLSGILNSLAAVLMKISNDLRWMNSGPLAGLAEISLKALQPGSSIMPGKVNPVIPEAIAMVAAQVAGNHQTISVAAQQGNFQLNVMLPVIAYNQLQSIELLSNACRTLGNDAIADFTVNHERLNDALSRNPILVTALNREIGYDKAASIAKQAYKEQRPIIDVAEDMTDLSRQRLEQLLDPQQLTRGGVPGEEDKS